MAHTIGGVGLTIGRSGTDETTISVVSKAKDSLAIEFIVEAIDGSWSSEVSAVRNGISVCIPASVSQRSFRVRLFNDIGKEINRDTNNLLEVASGLDQSRTNSVTPPGGKLKGLLLLAAVVCGAYFILGPGLSSKPSAPSSTPSTPSPSLAILSRSANLRSAPLLAKDNVVSTLPFGTQLFGISQSGDFLEVQVFGGSKGFIHKDVAGDANRVRLLGLKDSLQQAQATSDDRRTFILGAAQEVRADLLNATLLERSDWGKVDALFQSAALRTSGDDVAGRFFHYLAEEAAARRNFTDAVVYFRAAALSNPATVTDVHGWGVTQLRLAGAVDETAALHAVVVAPRSTNTWLMVAGHLAGQPAGTNQQAVVSALRLAVGFSSDRSVTKRFFQDLSRSTSNAVLKSALAEVSVSI